MPISDENTRKPKLAHDIRVGAYLYEHGYSRDIILAGFLHDALEFTEISEDMIRHEFGDEVLRLVKASTKDDTIADGKQKTIELIDRCVSEGEDALIVKAADILDSFKYYTAIENQEELGYCMRNANAILTSKPDTFQDKIFPILKQWQEK
ncbi:MAG: HD domain-containing protein [Candidatus Moranbacteria bacterium]|nr:HD domain-containing protein [Candidatus Moranbacteria bacterium]